MILHLRHSRQLLSFFLSLPVSSVEFADERWGHGVGKTVLCNRSRTGTAGTSAFCLSGTGTVMHSGAGIPHKMDDKSQKIKN
jgi:hypothetical protein